MPRQRIPIAFGRGLERGKGAMIVDPGSIQDIRNVYLSGGKAIVRLGMSEAALFVDDEDDPITDICGIHAQRTEQVTIVVGYQAATGKIFVYRVTSLSGGTFTPLSCEAPGGGTRPFWHQITAMNPPPRVLLASSYNLLFIAHDEPVLLNRAETVYYDPAAGTPIRRLLLDLKVPPTGNPGPVRFRGVARHLAYIWGWGWGADFAAERDRPELVRHCLPAQPLVWDPTHYQLIGQRGEPVLNAVSAGSNLVVLKGADVHHIFGYDRSTFGHKPIDPVYGLAASRLAVPFRGGVAYWSTNGGPRWTSGAAASEDMERDQLELLGLEPADLVAPDEIENGFACDLVSRKVLYFFFGQQGYAFHYGTPRPEWSYEDRAVPLFCSGELFTADDALAQPPTGYAEFIPDDDPDHEWTDTIGDFTAAPWWRNIGATGGEILEIWLTPDGGNWSLHTSRNVDALSVHQQVAPPLTGLLAGTLYDIAYRYRRGGQFAPGYEGATPDNWTAATADDSKGQFTTTLTARVLEEPIWHRDSDTEEFMTLNWSGGPMADTDIEVSDDGESWTVVDTVTDPGTTYEYEIPMGDGETYRFFRAVVDGGAPSNVWESWLGPPRPRGFAPYPSNPCTGCPPYINATCAAGSGGDCFDPEGTTVDTVVDVVWVRQPPAGLPGVDTRVQYETDTNPGFQDVSFPTPGSSIGFSVPSNEGEVRVRMRHEIEQFTVTDFSDWLPSANGATVPGSETGP